MLSDERVCVCELVRHLGVYVLNSVCFLHCAYFDFGLSAWVVGRTSPRWVVTVTWFLQLYNCNYAYNTVQRL